MKKQKVKIKTWQEMEEEFGLDELEDINCEECFTQLMEELLPKDRIIEIDLGNKWNFFNISEDMIKEKYDSFEQNKYLVSRQNIDNLVRYLEDGKEYEVIIRSIEND